LFEIDVYNSEMAQRQDNPNTFADDIAQAIPWMVDVMQTQPIASVPRMDNFMWMVDVIQTHSSKEIYFVNVSLKIHKRPKSCPSYGIWEKGMGKWIYECQGGKNSCETHKVAPDLGYGFCSEEIMDMERIG